MATPAGNSPARTRRRVYEGLALTIFFWGNTFPTSKMLVLGGGAGVV